MNPFTSGRSPYALSRMTTSSSACLPETLEQVGWEGRRGGEWAKPASAFEKRPPDVVLLDVMMPEMDGFRPVPHLRQLPGRGTHPHSDYDRFDDFESITKAYDAGATDFIVKPLNAMLLTHRIRYMVRANQVPGRALGQPGDIRRPEMPRSRAPDSNRNSWRP